MSGVLRAHDLTYEILGKIIKYGAKSVAWTATSLADMVVSSLTANERTGLAARNPDTGAEVRRLIYYAKRKQYLDGSYATTTKGKDRLAVLEFSRIKLESSWDGKWRLVMFDIPEEKRGARDKVRRLLSQLGFMQLQKSVWIHPLPCLDHFKEIHEAYGLGNDLILLETNDFAGSGAFIKKFRKLYPGLSD